MLMRPTKSCESDIKTNETEIETSVVKCIQKRDDGIVNSFQQ